MISSNYLKSRKHVPIRGDNIHKDLVAEEDIAFQNCVTQYSHNKEWEERSGKIYLKVDYEEIYKPL